MTEEEIKGLVSLYKDTENEVKGKSLILESIKNQLRVELEERGVEEYCSGDFVIRSKEILTSVFDKTRFKLKYEELYNLFLKQVVSRKFSIS